MSGFPRPPQVTLFFLLFCVTMMSKIISFMCLCVELILFLFYIQHSYLFFWLSNICIAVSYLNGSRLHSVMRFTCVKASAKLINVNVKCKHVFYSSHLPKWITLLLLLGFFFFPLFHSSQITAQHGAAFFFSVWATWQKWLIEIPHHLFIPLNKCPLKKHCLNVLLWAVPRSSVDSRKPLITGSSCSCCLFWVKTDVVSSPLSLALHSSFALHPLSLSLCGKDFSHNIAFLKHPALHEARFVQAPITFHTY